MKKLEGNEIWEVYGATENKIAAEISSGTERREAAMKIAQDWIFSILAKIHLAFETEDGEYPATMQDLQQAVYLASSEQLEKLPERKCLPFEDGYIVIK